MKRTILTAALIAAISTASFATGNGNNGAKATLVNTAQKGKYNLIYTDNTPGDVVVKVYDSKNHLLRTDKIKNKKGFKQPYDMKNLDAGTYRIVVADSEGETSLIAQVGTTEEFAVNRLTANKYQVIYKDWAGSMASVGIYDESGVLVFSEDVEFKNGFSKVYDLSKVTSSGFTFEVSADHKSKRVSF